MRTLTIEFNYCLKMENRYTFCLLEIIDEFSYILKKFAISKHTISHQDFLNKMISVEFILNNNSDYTVDNICSALQYYSQNKYMAIIITNVSLSPKENDVLTNDENNKEEIADISIIKKNKRRKIISIKTLKEL
jgi:hypothetical protein